MTDTGTPSSPAPWTPRQVATRAGLPLVGVLLAGSTLWAVPHIEETLERDTVAALEANGIDTSTLDIDFDYRDGSITGRVPADLVNARLADVEIDGARGLTSDVTGRRAVGPPDGDVTPELSFDAEVTAVFDEETVRLDGVVGTGRDRDVLLSAAAGSGRQVEGDVEVDGPDLAGATVGPVDALGLILSGLPPGSEGSAGLSGPALTADVTVPDDDAAAQLDEAISRAQAVPGMVFGLSIDVAAPGPTDTEPPADTAPPADSEPTDTEPTDTEPTEIGDADALAEALAVIGPIPFGGAGADLTDGARTTLDRVAEAMAAEPEVPVLIVGHTESAGESVDNQLLSEERAVAVADYLSELGIDTGRLIPAGRGEDDPAATNATNAGRRANERVTFEVLGGGNS